MITRRARSVKRSNIAICCLLILRQDDHAAGPLGEAFKHRHLLSPLRRLRGASQTNHPPTGWRAADRASDRFNEFSPSGVSSCSYSTMTTLTPQPPPRAVSRLVPTCPTCAGGGRRSHAGRKQKEPRNWLREPRAKGHYPWISSTE